LTVTVVVPEKCSVVTEIDQIVSVEVDVVSIETDVKTFETDELANQYELHCSQQSPAKDMVTFPVVGGVVIIGALDEAETNVVSSSFMVLDGTIDRGDSPIAVSAEWVIPIPAAMKSPTLLDLPSMLCEERCSIELMTDGSKAEAEVEAADETNEVVVALVQTSPVRCE